MASPFRTRKENLPKSTADIPFQLQAYHTLRLTSSTSAFRKPNYPQTQPLTNFTTKQLYRHMPNLPEQATFQLNHRFQPLRGTRLTALPLSRC
jgi:hypothetical protein